jgi:DNA-binding Lrp family transcriptional regulator
MPTAYILINTEIGAEKQVLKALKKVEGVEEAHSLWGVYDIIASVKAESMDALKYIITNPIEKISGITSKLTMLTNENKQTETQDHMVFGLAPVIQ